MLQCSSAHNLGLEGPISTGEVALWSLSQALSDGIISPKIIFSQFFLQKPWSIAWGKC